MMATRSQLAHSVFALALTIHPRPVVWEGNALLLRDSADPFTPRPRSKGEKARKRKKRGRA